MIAFDVFTFVLLSQVLVFAVAALNIHDVTLGFVVGAAGALLSVLGLLYGTTAASPPPVAPRSRSTLPPARRIGLAAVAMADAVEALPPPPLPESGVGGGAESGRSSPSPAASPEFEFWMVGRTPAPALLTTDELFSGGVVLPLHNLQAAAPDGDHGAATSEADAKEADAGGDAKDNAGAGADDKDADSTPLPLPEAEGEAAQPLAESGIAPTPDLPAVTFQWKRAWRLGAPSDGTHGLEGGLEGL